MVDQLLIIALKRLHATSYEIRSTTCLPTGKHSLPHAASEPNHLTPETQPWKKNDRTPVGTKCNAPTPNVFFCPRQGYATIPRKKRPEQSQPAIGVAPKNGSRKALHLHIGTIVLLY